jgi:hypothetical protein
MRLGVGDSENSHGRRGQMGLDWTSALDYDHTGYVLSEINGHAESSFEVGFGEGLGERPHW